MRHTYFLTGQFDEEQMNQTIAVFNQIGYDTHADLLQTLVYQTIPCQNTSTYLIEIISHKINQRAFIRETRWFLVFILFLILLETSKFS